MSLNSNYQSIGFIGLGKLGLPCAAAMQVKTGTPIYGFDTNPEVRGFIDSARVPYMERDIEEFLERAELLFCENIAEVALKSDVVFLAIQTPHDPSFEGITPVPNETKDFDYRYLNQVIDSLVSVLNDNPQKFLDIVVISTVLPGTMRKHVIPKLEQFGRRVNFFYNPYFIAMGTTIPDFLNPEFTLIGTDSGTSEVSRLVGLYRQIHGAEVRVMQVESAELTKVAYNTFIGFKIVFSNYINEICQKLGGDSDEVTLALAHATDRLISPKYLSAGMADGGGCHPRDQIAMSHLAISQDLSADPSGWMARARDAQTLRQAELCAELASSVGLEVCLLGLAYKKDVNLTVGSPALLLRSFLEKMGRKVSAYDPFASEEPLPSDPRLFFVSTNHTEFMSLRLPDGSVIVDPWGNSISQDLNPNSQIIRPGRS